MLARLFCSPRWHLQVHQLPTPLSANRSAEALPNALQTVALGMTLLCAKQALQLAGSLQLFCCGHAG